MLRAFIFLTGFLAFGTMAAGTSAQAQGAGGNPFAPVITVNDLGITGYELDQRMRFLELLRAPGDLREAAEKALIEDRIRVFAAERAGIRITEEAVNAGMEEFAGRASRPVEEFLKAIAENGVEPQTFRDFVTAGVVWRDLVRAEIAPRVRITDADIDRAMALESDRGKGTRVLLSEIILPAPPGQEGAAMAEARRISQLRGEGAFGAAARQSSASGSAARGGRLDWMPIENMPPALRGAVLGLEPGEASQPIQIPNAVAVFMLRAIDEGGPIADTPQQIDFAQLLIPGAGTETAATLIATLRARADTCDDLYAVAKGIPPEQIQRETLPQTRIPQDIALELAHLDAGESSTAIVRGGNQVFLMLCKRDRIYGEEDLAPSRDEVRGQLMNARIAAMAEGRLADLIADAVIVRND